MASNVDILLRGHNQASPAIQGVKNDLTGLDRAAGGLAGGLGTLSKAFGALGVGMLVMQVGRGVVALGQMGEESAQMEARFTALVGGAAEATRQFQAMDAATGQWLTRDEKMESATRIMSLGLATSAGEAANLARMAVMLGDTTQSATQRIDSFTQMLATGQTRGLTNFGISVITVRNRIDELRKANASLSQEQATQQAIMEAAAAKMQMLGDYMPITQTQQMANATADLKDSLGDLVAQPYIVTVKFLTGGINQVTDILTARPTEIDALTPQMISAENSLQRAREGLAKVKAESTGAWDASLIAAWEQEVARAQEQVNSLAVAMAVTKATIDNSSASMLGLGAAMALAVSRTQETSEETSSLSAALDTLRSKDEAAKINTVAMAIFRGELTLAKAEALGLAGALALVNAPKTKEFSWYNTANADAYGRAMSSGTQAQAGIDWQEREAARIEAAVTANKRIASSYQTEMERAGEAAANKIEGYLSEGVNFSIGLNDMRGGAGGLAPGQNGAFEDIYRLQAWLNDDSWADVGQKIAGGDKEKGRKIVEDFQRGIFSPEVIGAIDVDALAREAGMASLAEKSQAAFSKAIAEKAGTSTVVVDTLLGMKADDKGVKPSDTAAENAMNTLAMSIGAQVKGKDFAGQMIGYGETIWGYAETGMVNKAKTSTAFQAAIDAMVAAAIAGALAP